MNDKTIAERRAHPRFQMKIELQGTPEDGGVVARMVTSDLSVGGVHCISTTDFPEMTRLAVRLLLPMKQGGNAVPLEVEAVVVRRKTFESVTGDPRYELALFFTNMENGDRDMLTRYLDSNA